MKIFKRIIAALAKKFLPNQQLVDTYQVPADLDHKTLSEAAKKYWHLTNGPLDARDMTVQLYYSENDAFSSLAKLAYDLVDDNSLRMEAECAYAIGVIMREVSLRLEKMNARV